MKKILIFALMLGIIVMNHNFKDTDAIDISAETFVLMDIDSKRVLDSKDKDKRMLTASIAKIMTLLVTIKYANLDDYVTITEDDVNQIGSKTYIEVGESVSLRSLCYGLILRSGNDAAYAIAMHVGGSLDGFVYLMNETAKEIGMKNTTFGNPSGLDEDTKNYSTAYDMGLLTIAGYEYEEFVQIFESTDYTVTTKSNKTYQLTGKHKLVNQKGIYLGGKTGYTVKAKRTLVTTAEKDDVKLVAVTFNDPNDWIDHEKLFEYGFSTYSKKTLIQRQIIKQNELDLDFLIILDKNIVISIKEEEKIVCLFKVKKEPDINAGYVIIYIDGEEIFTYPLKAYFPSDEESTLLLDFL